MPTLSRINIKKSATATIIIKGMKAKEKILKVKKMIPI